MECEVCGLKLEHDKNGKYIIHKHSKQSNRILESTKIIKCKSCGKECYAMAEPKTNRAVSMCCHAEIE